MKQIRPLKYVLSIILALTTCSAMAQINTALISGAWETGTNWSTGSAPLTTDAVTIPAGISMSVSATTDVCASITVIASGTLTINAAANLSIGGNVTNTGNFYTLAGSTLTFNGAANSTILGGGAYTIAGTIVLNMGSAATALDVKDFNFISGINSGANYFFTLISGTWKMDNTNTLKDFYNSGTNNALTIPFGVVIESDAGTMNLCKNASGGSAILSGKIFMNGGVVNVQTGQSFNSGQDFKYSVNGGTPQLYIAGGNLNIGAGFNANAGSDYIDFHMTGGTVVLAVDGYSNWITFQLADVVGGKTFMSSGLIVLQDACNANIEDLDMGGANVAATQYSVTGGTVQLGYLNTQAGATYFGIDAQPATNYPNFIFLAGVPKNASAFNGGVVNMISLSINTNMTFDASGFSTVNITGNNGAIAFDDEGTFVQSSNTVSFSGAVKQVITSTAHANENFYNLQISNTFGNVVLAVPTTVTNNLSFTSGLLDASSYPMTVSSGNAITGTSATKYIITGNGVAKMGYLNIANLPANTVTNFPIGNTSYYFPATLNPGANTGNAYSAFVYQGATSNGVAGGPSLSGASLTVINNVVWNIGQTAGSGSATLALGWNASAATYEGTTFKTDGTNIGIAQFTGGNWQLATGSGNEVARSATTSTSSFTAFLAAQLNYLLPIVISNFDAVLKSNNTVQLSWTVSDANDINDFEVQRSAGGAGWNTIGTVQALTNAQGDYSFVDESPVAGENDYRLLIKSIDDKTSYSTIRSVTLTSGTARISTYPNPTTDVLNVSVSDAEPGLSIRLISMSGQLLQSVTPASSGTALVSMNVRNYARGVYILQVISAGRVLQTNSVAIMH